MEADRKLALQVVMPTTPSPQSTEGLLAALVLRQTREGCVVETIDARLASARRAAQAIGFPESGWSVFRPKST